MSKSVLILIFIASLLVGSVLPATGHRNNYLVIVFLTALMVYWGVNGTTIWLGLLCAALFELWQALPLGSIIVPFLATALAIAAFSQVLNIKPSINESYFRIITGPSAVTCLFAAIFFIFTIAAGAILAGNDWRLSLGSLMQNYAAVIISVAVSSAIYLTIFYWMRNRHSLSF